MTEHTLKDIEQRIKLTKFERNLDTKRVKVGKFFWHSSFIYITSGIKIEPFIFTNSYSDIFYRPAEIQLHILEHFSGEPMMNIEDWNLQKYLEKYRQRVFSGVNKLVTQMKDFLSTHPQDFNLVDPAAADFLELDFIDNKQPYLPSPSKIFKRILEAAHYDYQDNLVFTDFSYIKPSLVHTLNSTMNNIIVSEAFFQSVSFLQNMLKTSSREFNPQLFVDGPTEAIHKAISLEPDIVSYSVPQLSYLIRLKYVDENGRPLNEETLKKAIVRYKSMYGR